ncbi:MAG: glycosyltransferase family 1 protein [Tissierellia bacterium]|nr:glycosyltransferase family 1 protein [Tissierellia bacterium]
MRIALITETFLPSTDGVVVRLTKALDYLLSQGHEVLIIAPEIEGMARHYKGAKIQGAKSVVFPFYKERPWALPTSKVKDWLLDFKPDIVHAVNPITLAASGAYYADKLNIPLICSFHTNIPNYLTHYHLEFLENMTWSFLRKVHNKAPLNLVTSQAMYDLLDANGIQGLRVLPKGVDLDQRDPRFYSEERRTLMTQGQPEKTALLFVGRLAPEKEIHRLYPLMAKRDDLSLTLVGDGPEREKLEELFQGTRTQFTGFVHGQALSELYASADAFIFPSASETLGLVITEAMASGTPVIAANSQPTREQIKDRENGLIFDQEDLRSLERAIDALKDPLLKEGILEKGYAYAQPFSWDQASKAILEAYEDTLALYDHKKALEVS